MLNCACKKARLTISARIHLSKMSQPVQNDNHGGVRLFENSDIEIIEIVRNNYTFTNAFQKMAPFKPTPPVPITVLTDGLNLDKKS